MNKRILLCCLLVSLLLVACTPGPPPQVKPAVGDERTIDLHPVIAQERELLAVFGDFTGISDYALVGGQLEYVQDEVLWVTELDGIHRVKQATDYASWQKEVASRNEMLRLASTTPPYFFADIDGDNIRMQTSGGLAAYRRANGENFDLMLSTSVGDTRCALAGAAELVLLGWHGNWELLVAASLPGLESNIYLVNMEPELVEINNRHVDTFTPALHASLSLDLKPGLVKIWQYDDEQFAYQAGGKVFAYNLTTGHQQELANIGSADVIWGARNLFITLLDEHSNLTLWYQGEHKPVSGQLQFTPDWVNDKLYYLSLAEEQNGMFVMDLPSLQETELASASPETAINCFALSPDKQRLLFVAGTKATYDPNEQVDETAFIVDLATGVIQEVAGLDKDGWVRHEQAVWIRPDLIALGHRGLWSPEDGQTLSFYTLAGNRLSLKRATKLNSGLFTPDGRGVFLNDRDYSDGYDPSFKANIWCYDAQADQLQQLTQKKEGQIQQDQALAYSPQHQLLFVSRFKGYMQPSSYSGRLEHGVLVDKQGREYTLLKTRNNPILHAIWMGNQLLIQTTDSVLVYGFAEQ